jgi:ubiquinone/menaquinone biosynthesis C-methylase UbiE
MIAGNNSSHIDYCTERLSSRPFVIEIDITTNQTIDKSWKLQDLELEDAIADIYDKLYHTTRFSDYMYRSFVSLISETTQTGETVLELACGTATITQMLQQSRSDLKCHCMDLSEGMLRIASKRCPDCTRSDMENLPYHDNVFGTVVVHSALHHFPNLDKIFFEVKRVLQKGGHVIIQEPNKKTLQKVLSLRVLNFVAQSLGIKRYPDLSYLETGQPSEHHGLLDMEKVVDSLAKTGFEITKADPVFYSSAYFRQLDSRVTHEAGKLADRFYIRKFHGGYMFHVLATSPV